MLREGAFKNTVQQKGEERHDLFTRITQAYVKYIKSLLSVIYKLGVYICIICG